MKEIILDTLNIKTLDELHSELQKVFQFPDYYGRNLDALYDMLSGEIELPVKLIWKNFSQTQKSIGKPLDQIKKLFEDFSQEEDSFVFELR